MQTCPWCARHGHSIHLASDQGLFCDKHKAEIEEMRAKQSIEQCCCNWGVALADKDSGEWPEFECIDCPIHKNAFGMADRLCKRHRGFGPTS